MKYGFYQVKGEVKIETLKHSKEELNTVVEGLQLVNGKWEKIKPQKLSEVIKKNENKTRNH